MALFDLLTLGLKNVILFSVMKVYLETLGCKLNESELEEWTRKFAAEGDQIVNDPADADICVLNTCTVTSSAARKSRNLARHLAKANPSARLVLTGCYASTMPKEARGLPNVALVLPNGEKDKLVQLARELLPVADCTAEATMLNLNSQFADRKHQNLHRTPLSGVAVPVLTSTRSRTRAFVKIQDGCNMSCTYCIIPFARGKERSRPMLEVVSEVQALVDSGYKEIILTGVQISEYRQSLTHPAKRVDGARLNYLVAAILRETNVPRLRLTSIAPWDLDESLLDLFSDPHLCRHLHLSLQSGSDTVLRRMRRPYATEQFSRAVELARIRIPDIAITTDVIVGFPGESDSEFEESLAFVERMQFARVHVFPYSARAGTQAAGYPLQVSDAMKEMRSKRMQMVANHAARTFASRFIGRRMEVLWEHPEEGGQDQPTRIWPGYTDNYLRVIATSEVPLYNRIAPAILDHIIGDGSIAATIQGG